MQKAILNICATVLGLTSLAYAYSGGNGTPEDPYQIATVQDLIDLGRAKDDYSKSFILTADIDLADWVFDRAVIAPGTEWNIFTSFGGTPFSGRFDGQGHVIRNLRIDGHAARYQGLFGKLAEGAEIANLGLEGVQVSGYEYVGALVGENGWFPPGNSSGGTISSCYSIGTVKGEENVGGLVGINYGPVSSSYSTGTVNGTRAIGGLVGQNVFGHISSNYSTGGVYGIEHVGGLVGLNYSGTISSSYSTGMVSGEERLGGLVGVFDESGTISSSYSVSRVFGTRNIGGLVGYIYKSWSGIISSSYSTGMVSGEERVGGLVGLAQGSGAISSTYSTGAVSGEEKVGGLVGYVSEAHWSGTILSSFWAWFKSG